MNRLSRQWRVGAAISWFCVVASAPALAQTVPQWTGFHFGVHAGYGIGDANMVRTDTLLHATIVGPAYLRPISVNAGDRAAVAGLHFGYNWSLASQWIGGLEADWSWFGLKASNSAGPLVTFEGNPAIGSYVALDAQVKGLGSVRGRVGFAQPNWLPYVTGGLALAQLDFKADMYCPAFNCGDTLAPASLGRTRLGWVVGGGIEFTQPRSPWTVGMEYLHYRFDESNSQDAALISKATGQPDGLGSCSAGDRCIHYSFGRLDMDTVRLRLNYKFN